MLLRLRGSGAGAGFGVGSAGFAAGFGSATGLFFNLLLMMRCASVPCFAYAGKSHHWHAALIVPFSACFTGISWPQHMQAIVPMCVFGLVAKADPLDLLNQVFQETKQRHHVSRCRYFDHRWCLFPRLDYRQIVVF